MPKKINVDIDPNLLAFLTVLIWSPAITSWIAIIYGKKKLLDFVINNAIFKKS